MSALPSLLLSLTRPFAHFGLADWLTRGVAGLRSIGPYAVIEIVLPGGTLLALLLWLYRRQRRVVALRSADQGCDVKREEGGRALPSGVLDFKCA